MVGARVEGCCDDASEPGRAAASAPKTRLLPASLNLQSQARGDATSGAGLCSDVGLPVRFLLLFSFHGIKKIHCGCLYTNWFK